MLGWLRRLVDSRHNASRAPEDFEPLRFTASPKPRPLPSRPVLAVQPGAKIIDRYVYGSRNGGGGPYCARRRISRHHATTVGRDDMPRGSNAGLNAAALRRAKPSGGS